MEKIQHALAKARAERDARLAEQRAQEVAPAPPPEPEPEPQVAEELAADPPPPAAVEVSTPEPEVASVEPDRESFVAPAPAPSKPAEVNERQDPAPREDVATEVSDPPTDPASAWEAIEPFVISPAIKERNRIVALQEGRAGSEFDMLRTRVLQQMRANNWRRLAITSPTPACGKSTIALNLAFAISRQPDIHTVLMELDLRRPSLAGALGVTDGHQFSHVLDGKAPFSENALRHGNNLIIATNKAPSKHTSELLQSQRASQALCDIEATYAPDFIIMDMPPMLVSDDTIAFMGQTDCVLLVAAAETTTVKELDLCERELSQHTNVMGVVLNKCRHMGPERDYGYYG